MRNARRAAQGRPEAMSKPSSPARPVENSQAARPRQLRQAKKEWASSPRSSPTRTALTPSRRGPERKLSKSASSSPDRRRIARRWKDAPGAGLSRRIREGRPEPKALAKALEQPKLTEEPRSSLRRVQGCTRPATNAKRFPRRGHVPRPGRQAGRARKAWKEGGARGTALRTRNARAEMKSLDAAMKRHSTVSEMGQCKGGHCDKPGALAFSNSRTKWRRATSTERPGLGGRARRWRQPRDHGGRLQDRNVKAA